MTLGTVTVCARYPVKSVRGEQLDRLELVAGGVPGDRLWAMRTEDGKRGSGKNTDRWARLAHMLDMSSRLSGDSAVLRLPNGREFDVASPSLPAELSAVVGRPVTLTAAAEGPHRDLGQVHLITTSSLRWWAGQVPEARIGWQRARPNLVVDVPGAERAEDDWVGRRLAVGSAVLEVTAPTVRCVMVTQDQLGLGASSDLLRVLAPYELRLGVYANVVTPGHVALGDPVFVS